MGGPIRHRSRCADCPFAIRRALSGTSCLSRLGNFAAMLSQQLARTHRADRPKAHVRERCYIHRRQVLGRPEEVDPFETSECALHHAR